MKYTDDENDSGGDIGGVGGGGDSDGSDGGGGGGSGGGGGGGGGGGSGGDGGGGGGGGGDKDDGDKNLPFIAGTVCGGVGFVVIVGVTSLLVIFLFQRTRKIRTKLDGILQYNIIYVHNISLLLSIN